MSFRCILNLNYKTRNVPYLSPSCLTAFLKGARSFTGVTVTPPAPYLFKRLDLVSIPLLALEGDGFGGGLAQNGLLVLAELVPDDLAHEEDFGQAQMVVEEVVLCNLIVVEGDEGRRVVLGPIDDAGLFVSVRVRGLSAPRTQVLA
jgi:hypothetical protein